MMNNLIYHSKTLKIIKRETVINKKSWQCIKYSKKEKEKSYEFITYIFALPVAVIIISIALQKILKCPVLVAAIIFAIFLIVTFVINNINFLVAALIYAILAFITAVIVCLICRLIERFCDNDDDSCGCGCGRSGCGCRRNRRCNCQRDRDNSMICLE